jgi:hypothetical protein
VAYAIFDTPAIHAITGIAGIKDLAQAGVHEWLCLSCQPPSAPGLTRP